MSRSKNDRPSVALETVRRAELETLRAIAVAAFAEGLRDYGKRPDGIETIDWHERGCAEGSYLAIRADGRLAGGARVFDYGEGVFRLGSLFVDPALHGRGIGSQALAAIERRYPQASRWSLDTPALNARSRRFYENAGYVNVGNSPAERASDFRLIDYVKLPLLLEIREADLFPGRRDTSPREEAGFALRQAARAVLLDADGRMALMRVTRSGLHKLPGGGIEAGENVFAALRRELREEVGAGEIQLTDELGMTAEYIAEYRLKQFSYAYAARLSGPLGASALTAEEQSDGFALIWTRPEEALRLMRSDRPNGLSGHFIRCRDLAIVRRFLEQGGSGDVWRRGGETHL